MTSMKEYKVIIDKMEWHGGDGGYGLPISRLEQRKKFANDQAALKWAYSIVDKSPKKALNQNTVRTVYSVDVIDPSRKTFNGISIQYGVQLFKGKIRVWALSEWGYRGFLLNPDGTINRRGGGIA